jgi:hypothetical protein
VYFGATYDLTEHDVTNAEDLIKQHKVLITSMMIKPAIALCALKIGRKNNRKNQTFNLMFLFQFEK